MAAALCPARPVVLNQGELRPQGTFGDIRRHFWLLRVGGWCTTGIQRDAATSYGAQGDSCNTELPAQNVNRAYTETPGVFCLLTCLPRGPGPWLLPPAPLNARPTAQFLTRRVTLPTMHPLNWVKRPLTAKAGRLCAEGFLILLFK